MAQQDKTWESAWQSAMENKSVTPPEDVWDNITTELDKPKRHFVQPVWWAAAAVSIIAVAGVLLFEGNTENPDLINASEMPITFNDSGIVNEIPAVPDVSDKMPTPGNSDNRSIVLNPGERDLAGGNNAQVMAEPKVNADEPKKVYDFIPELIEGVKTVAFDLQLPEFGEIWGVPMVEHSRKKSSTGWYAGLDISTGSSTSATNSSSANMNFMSPLQASTYNAPVPQEVSTVSSSTSYGITMGKKLSRKIILESGLTYMRLENTATSNVALTSANKREAFNLNARLNDAMVTTTTPYSVENVHQFISIPVKAGYVVLDQRWKMSLNAGVSGDYFIKTHTEDLTGNLQMYESSPSADPQWNSLSMSVLGEVNISRELGRNYMIAITPQMRQSLNDFSNTRTELKPFVLQVGVQLKYRFR